MDTLKYRALLYAVDTGSFRAAAEKLGYTTAGIFNMVNSVEEELGVAILNRGHFGVELSSSGEELIRHRREVVRMDDLLKGRALDMTGLVTGRVSIGAYFSISAHFLPEIFSRFHRDFPGVEIDLHEGGYQSLESMRKESLVDLCVPPEHPLADAESVSLEDCLKEDFIMPANGKDHDVERLFGKRFRELKIRYKTLENYSALAMVEKGMGISVMNRLITRRLDFRVKYIPFHPQRFLHFGILIPSLNLASPAAKKMIEYIKKEAELFN